MSKRKETLLASRLEHDNMVAVSSSLQNKNLFLCLYLMDMKFLFLLDIEYIETFLRYQILTKGLNIFLINL